MNRILSFGIISFLGVILLNTHLGYAKDISEKEVKKIEEEAKQKSIESKQLQAQAIQLNLELSKIDKNVISLAKEIQQKEDLLSEHEEKLAKLQKDLALKEEAFSKENQSLVQTLAALQNISLNPSESVILQPLSPVDIIRSAILLRETIPFLSKKSAKLRTDLENIYEQKKKIENMVSNTKKQTASLEKQQKDMKILLDKKAVLRKNVEEKGIETQKIADNLILKAKNLRDLLDELERQKEIERKKREEAARLANLNKQKQQKAVDSKAHASIKAKTKGHFTKAKGHLARPVRGNILTKYGQLISKGVTSKGIVYQTRAQAQVIAPYDGTVIFSGPFKGYGNIIIIEHGDGYLSLLAGLGNIDCDVGQNLLTGEPVGIMPNNSNAKLYFEIRKDRLPINPSPWVAG